MFKKLLLFSTMAIIGGCETINQANQCDPDKNYIISNPSAMQEYQKLKSEGKIKSIYINYSKPNVCNDISCVAFYKEKYDFMERNFNDQYRKGIYTIKIKKESDECLKGNNISTKFNDICFVTEKNIQNIAVSEYEWYMDNSNENYRKIIFKNRLKNESLFEYSYQVYSTGAIGGPGFGKCPQLYRNNNLKFNPNEYP